MDGKTPGQPEDQERREDGYVLQAQLLSTTGHDCDCALAILSQAEHGRPLDNIQVVHLLSIGRRAGYQAGREDAAREIEVAAELAGWGEVWAEAVSLARGTIDLGRFTGGVGDNTEEQQQGNTP